MAKKSMSKDGKGLYRVQVFLGTVNGKNKYKSFRAKTLKEANRKADEFREKLNKGIDVNAESDTFEFWMQRWMKNKEVTVSQSRLSTCKTHACKLQPLYNKQIGKIRTFEIQEIINALYIKNPNTGKPSSKDLLKCVRNTAVQIFDTAINNRVLDYNPAIAVTIPSKAEEGTRTALTDEQISWVINTPHRAQLPAMLMLYAGLRRGEVLALTWADIDLTSKTISVNKSVEMIHGKPILKQGGKTKASTRIIYIPKALCDFLEQQERKSILVCPNTQGQIMSSSSWDNMWKSYMCDLNMLYGNFGGINVMHVHSKFAPIKAPMMIKPFTAHQLRHTFATMLYFAGVDILAAKEQLGHSDIKTTLEIYTHLDEQFKKRSMDKLDDFLNNKSNTATHTATTI